MVTEAGEVVATLGRPRRASGEWWHVPLSGMVFEAGGQRWRWNGQAFEVPEAPPEEGT